MGVPSAARSNSVLVTPTLPEGQHVTTDASRSDTSAPSVSQPKVNTLSIVSVVFVAVVVAGFLIGGAAVLAVFAVGTGHVALQQIKERGERGAILAYIGLGISYLIATYALVAFVYAYFTHFTA